MQSSDTLLEFPCDFQIKALGLADGEFEALVVAIVRRHVGDLPEGAVKARPSRQGKYVAVTVTIRAETRTQLDGLYSELSSHDKVVMVL